MNEEIRRFEEKLRVDAYAGARVNEDVIAPVQLRRRGQAKKHIDPTLRFTIIVNSKKLMELLNF